ncbi:MAG TPA: BlaI/MecI/CopY family transcriptional regulator [Verrucomicrobiae bacterium]|nr:BlaI/MecI/CopY family transcriptional regulator [Verrucomicrobiae bacterium]
MPPTKSKPESAAISSAEWKIMRVLWDKHPQPAYDIIQSLEKTESWHPNTIKTLLNRLVKKKALTVEKYKNLFLYSPALKEADCVSAESQSFLERFFGGDVRPLLIHFAENKQLTAEDLAELQKILRQSKK